MLPSNRRSLERSRRFRTSIAPRLEVLERRALLASFQGLGFLPAKTELSYASAVSADGSVVVGYSEPGAFVWTAGSGLQAIGGTNTVANGVSADGTVVAGQTLPTESGAPPEGEAFLWTAEDGLVPEFATAQSTGPQPTAGTVGGISADGTTVVGSFYSLANGIYAYRWTASGGLVALPRLPGSRVNDPEGALAVSADGSVIVGVGGGSTGADTATLWTAAGAQSLGTSAGGFSPAEATAVSSDGSVVAGFGASGTGADEAFRWTQAQGTMALGLLPGDVMSEANGVSSDGSMVVGYSSSNKGSHAFVWTAANGMQSIQSLLESDPAVAASIAGWTLTTATAISSDGTTIVGNGIDPSGDAEAWVAQLGGESTRTSTTTVLRSSVNPSHVDQPVTFTAVVSPATSDLPAPTGTVTFLNGSTVIGSKTLDASGTATLSVSTLPAGDLPIVADYGGDSNNRASSDTLMQTVSTLPDLAMDSVALSVAGQSVTATYSIAGSDLPAAGSIDFFWATGPDLADAIGMVPAATLPTALQASATPYLVTTPLSSLGAVPAGATDILAMADSPSADPQNDVVSVPYTVPGIEIVSAAISGIDIDYTYETTGNAGPFTVSLFDSPTTTYNPATAVPVDDPATGQPATRMVTPPGADQPSTPGAFDFTEPIQDDSALPYLLVVADPDNRVSPAGSGKADAIALPDIAITQAGYDPQGDVVFHYVVSGAVLAQDTSIAVYWAGGDVSSVDANDEIGPAVFVSPIATAATMAPGNHGPITVPASDLASSPAGATHLIVVADPPDEDDPLGTLIESDDSNDAQAVGTINLDPLEVEGDFTFNATTEQFEATGTILIGLAPAQGQSFTPLVSVAGSVAYDSQTIAINGVVTAMIGGISAPLYQGSWTIDVGQAVSSALSEAAQIPNQFTIAGTTFTLSSLAFVTDSQAGHLELQGALVLPAALGGGTLSVDGTHKVVISPSGVSFTGGTIQFPNVSIMVQNVLNLEAQSLSLQYDAADPATSSPAIFTLQGTVTVPAVYNFTANFSGANYISISGDAINLVGSISGDNINLPAPGWSFKHVEIDFDTVTGVFEGTATLVVPPGFDIAASITFVTAAPGQSLQLNDLTISASGLNLPIATTGAYLQSISGEVDHIAASDPAPTLYKGSVGITAGPQIDIRLPSWAGGEVMGALVGLNASGSLDSNHLSVSGNVNVVNGLAAAASATLLDDWDYNLISGSGSFTLLGGLISANASFQIDSTYDLTMQGSGTISLGPVLPAPLSLLASSLFNISGTAYLQYDPSLPLTGDYVEGFGTASLLGFGTVMVGERIDFAGNATPITSLTAAQPAPPPPSASDARADVRPDGVTADTLPVPAVQSFAVTPNTPRLLLSAQWSNATATPALEILGPDGTVYSTASPNSQGSVSVISALSGPGVETFGLMNPAAGTWTIEAPDTSGAGTMQFTGYVDSQPATLAFTTVTAQTAAPQVTLHYSAETGTVPATASFFYTTQAGAHDGIPIDVAVPVNSGPGSVVWNTAGVAPGTYYVYASVDDGVDPVSFDDESTPQVISSTQPTMLSLVSGTGMFDGTAALTATLTANGLPLAGAAVAFRLSAGGTVTPLGTATTNTSGVAALAGVSLAGLGAGTVTGGVEASFAGNAADAPASASGNLTVNPLVATLSLGGLAATYDGMPHTVTASTSPGGLDGVTVTYAQNNQPVAAPTLAGRYSVTATLSNPNATATIVTGTLVIAQAAPVVTWAEPADIIANTELSGAQLDATASVPGTFTYEPAAGAVLPVGQGIVLMVTFTPQDATDYVTETRATTINVVPTPTPAPSPTPPQILSIVPAAPVKGRPSFTVSFNEALVLNSASNPILYQVFAGVTKVVKKRHETVYTKALHIKSVSVGSNGKTVTIALVMPFKGTAQVTVRGAIEAANGTSSSVLFTAVVALH